MATITEIKTKIKNANALGVANLTEKGVDISADASTFDIMTAIAEITGGSGGIQYTNIVYNEDNTITLTDKDGVVHTMECEYTDGKLTSVKYDGKAVKLTYDGDMLVSVGSTAVDMANVPTEIDSLESLIDNSGVLEDTEGTVTEKVEELIDKAKSGSSPSIDENGIVTFGGDTTIDENGILSL